MTIEEDIDRALDFGDIESACLLAAQLERPQAYRDAMIRVNQIVANGMKGIHLTTPNLFILTASSR